MLSRWAVKGAVCLALMALGSPLAMAQDGEDQGDAGVQALEERIAALEEKLASSQTKDKSSADAAAALAAELASIKEALAKLEARADENRGQIGELIDELDAEATAAEDTFELIFSGFVRSEFIAIQDDRDQTAFIGLNDGFALSNARLVVDGHYLDTGFRLQFDGALNRFDAGNSAQGRVSTEIRDANFWYQSSPWLRLTVGQFKPPFDIEEWRSTVDLLFVSRSVAARGVRGVEGPAVGGLSRNRERGLMASSDINFIGNTGIGGAYYVAITNGNPGNRPLNDNDQFAFYGRFELYYEDILRVGGATYYNELTDQELADVINSQEFGLTGDISLKISDLRFNVMYVRVQTDFPQIETQDSQVSEGFHAEIGYDVLGMGLIPAYRMAFFDPTSQFEGLDQADSQLEFDELTYHTVGLTWFVPRRPIKVQANYTFTIEDKARVFNNDRLELMGQLEF